MVVVVFDWGYLVMGGGVVVQMGGGVNKSLVVVGQVLLRFWCVRV